MKRLNIIHGPPQYISKNKNKKTNSSQSPEVSLVEPWVSVRSTLRTYGLDIDGQHGRRFVLLCHTHKQSAEDAKPHLYKQERKRPTSMRRQLTLES